MALCRARSLGETRAGEGVNVHVSRVQGERPDEMSALKIWQRGLFDVVLLVRRRGSSTLACAWFFPFCNYEIHSNYSYDIFMQRLVRLRAMPE